MPKVFMLLLCVVDAADQEKLVRRAMKDRSVAEVAPNGFIESNAERSNMQRSHGIQKKLMATVDAHDAHVSFDNAGRGGTSDNTVRLSDGGSTGDGQDTTSSGADGESGELAGTGNTTKSSDSNVALGKPVTCSGIWPGSSCDSAVDGDENTGFASGHNGWIEVDLGAVFHIDSVALLTSFLTRYQVCSGVDDWAESCTVFSDANSGERVHKNVEYVRNARYVRITKLNDPALMLIAFELQVLGTPVLYYHDFHCASRAVCVDDLDLPAVDFVTFQCKCIDQHYKDYIEDSAWPSETPQKCKDFIACLQNEHTMSSRLAVSLAKALGSHGGGLVEEKSLGATGTLMPTTTPASQDPDSLLANECFEPSNSTFASLVECGCMKDLLDACGDPLVEDAEDCLVKHACKHSGVCQDWKDSKCGEGALQMRSGLRDRTLLHQLFLTGDNEQRRFQGTGMTFAQLQLAVASWGLTSEVLKALWDSLDTESNTSLPTERKHRLLDPLRDRTATLTQNSLHSQDDVKSLDAAVLGKCTAD
jgi:hypothetical protein